MRILLLSLLCIVGCSKTLVMNDSDLKNIQTERTKNIMLNNNTMVIPPDFEKVPTENESQYVAPKDNSTFFDKILKNF
jgi:hypothetical protein